MDPSSIIGRYGADTARWFMLSDSPPERDLEWTDAGAAGAWRFVQRVWRLVLELDVRAGRNDETVVGAPTGRTVYGSDSRPGSFGLPPN